ncbi:MAG: cobyrinic acid a,c-diamide synthase, partial [Elainellaceae cyanobacterium]
GSKICQSTSQNPPTHPSTPTPIAIAQDPAFSFYYADNLEQLQHWGAELIPWSPLNDLALPEGVGGLYLGGGFPEVFAAALAANQAARAAVRQAIQAGLPTYAECGGLMYLCRTLTDFEGHCHDMVGILPAHVRMGARLTLGYRQAIALQDSPLLQRESVVRGHEFHRSVVDQVSESPVYQMRGLQAQDSGSPEGWALPNLHASYLHLHWGDRPDLPQKFLQACARFVRKQPH